MNRFAHYLLRLLRVSLGFALAVAAGCAIVLIFDLNEGRIPELLAGSFFVGFLVVQVAGFIWPLLLVELAAEVGHWRGLVLHLGVGLAGALGALGYVVLQAAGEPVDDLLGDGPAFTVHRLAIHLIAGLAAGLLYWLVAGRSAGIQPVEGSKA
ncbi:hypothetical protein [Phreatobacter stygius]|uniref:Uncharacterized protein n=1 Tax=Phreatobacter stygius TaxID=1940610 RepID=A0A4D7B0G5_9HYPH|nr:hypothetical protein [Phreatobacter stygius]QCI64298.1 hypothetical protein E8M01_08615 [Phreatobacter stygius]